MYNKRHVLQSKLKKLVDIENNNLREIINKHHSLQQIWDSLKSASSPNILVYTLLCDSLSRTILDIASLYHSWMVSGGFIDKTKHCSPILRRHSWKHFTPPSGVYYRKTENGVVPCDRIKSEEQKKSQKQMQINSWNSSCKLFKTNLNQNEIPDFQNLRNNLKSLIKPVSEIRNVFAHYYPNKDIEMLKRTTVDDTFESVRRILQGMHDILNDYKCAGGIQESSVYKPLPLFTQKQVDAAVNTTN